MSVEDAVSRFLEDAEARHLAEATIGKQKLLLARLQAFAHEIGIKYASQLTAESMAQFRSRWTDSPISAAKKLERLRSFFRFCVGMKWIEDGIADAEAGVSKDKDERPEPRAVIVAERVLCRP